MGHCHLSSRRPRTSLNHQCRHPLVRLFLRQRLPLLIRSLPFWSGPERSCSKDISQVLQKVSNLYVPHRRMTSNANAHQWHTILLYPRLPRSLRPSLPLLQLRQHPSFHLVPKHNRNSLPPNLGLPPLGLPRILLRLPRAGSRPQHPPLQSPLATLHRLGLSDLLLHHHHLQRLLDFPFPHQRV